MERKILRTGTILALAVMAVLPVLIRAEIQIVRVTVENASVRAKPDLQSDILRKLEVGTLLEAQKKVGDWYEVAVLTEVGISVVGYIHEMFVRVEPAEEEAVEEKEAAEQEAVEPELEKPEEPAPALEPVPAGRPLRISPTIKLGGIFSLIQAGYGYHFSFPYYGQTGGIDDNVKDGSAMGFDLGLGVFIIKNLEIAVGFNMYSKDLEGTYGFSLPNKYISNDIAQDDETADVPFKATAFHFDVHFYPLSQGRIRPYLGAGGSSISAKMDLFEDATYRETYYTNLTHKIEIVELKLEETSLSKFGFNVNAGIGLGISSKIFIVLEGRYVLAKQEVSHLLTSSVDKDEKLTIDLGGLTAGFGIKIIL